MKNKHLSLQFSTVAVLSLCFFILVGGSLVYENVDRIMSSWGSQPQMMIYLQTEIEPEKEQDVFTELQRHPQIEAVERISPEKSIDQLKAQMAGFSTDLLIDQELTQYIPAAFQVRFKDNTNGTELFNAMKQLSQKLEQNEAVDEAVFGQDWFMKYSQISQWIKRTLWAIGAVLLLASLFVGSNVIRALINQYRFEIELRELLGATPRSIRAPFLFQGSLLGFAAMTIALTASQALFILLKDSLNTSLSFLKIVSEVRFLNPEQILFFLIAGATLGTISAWLCVRNMNTGWAAAQGLRR